MAKLPCKGCGIEIEGRKNGNKQLWLEASGRVHNCPNPPQEGFSTPKAEKPAPGASTGALGELVGRLTEEMATAAEQRYSDLAEAITSLTAKANEIDSIREELRSYAESRRVVVEVPGFEPRDMGRQHRQFDKLLKMMAARQPNDGRALNVWLYGKPGGFKTSGVFGAFTALGIPQEKQHVISFSNQTSEGKLIGYPTADGGAVITKLQEVYAEGGGMLLDEIDNSNPNALTVANTVIENAVAGFASGTVKRHPDCYFVAAANTIGHGANVRHIGRMKQDAATRNRFAFMEWEYDWLFTRDLLPERHHDWARKCERIDGIIDAKDLESVVSPRQAFQGAALFDAGFTHDEVMEHTVWAQMKEDDRETVKAALK